MQIIDPQELRQLLEYEIRQKWEEGVDTTYFEEKIREVNLNSRELLSIYEELSHLVPREPKYNEPSNLSDIRRLRPKGPRILEHHLSTRELYNKILGGWLGRCIGCMLGKPVEGWSRSKIRNRLTKVGEYPLRNYFPMRVFSSMELKDKFVLTREGIRRVERDDDIDYTIINLDIVEEYGLSFSTDNVGETWLLKLPYKAVYTAERCAYRNLILGFKPPETASFLNPFREWIGAQIRADLWGYICPGKPELAAELAFRDARLSHVKNGIYGEMFFSAVIASAFVEKDIEKLLEIGLSEIPSTSRFAEAIKYVIGLWKKGLGWEEALDKVQERYGFYSPVHTINNAAIVATALLWGEGRFTDTITIAVMGGLDTDCNGATAGSVIGVVLGADNIPVEWVEPLNNTIISYVAGFQESRITSLAERTTRVAESGLKSW